MLAMRTYGEYCSIARSLDVLGDRWTLLIVRELASQAPCRYTDLRRGLPGIATNLLAERLRELEYAGVVSRKDAPPPVATTLFRLTERGEELRPLLDHLRRWGIPLMAEVRDEDAVRGHWLTDTLAIMLSDQHQDAGPAVIEARIGDVVLAIQLGNGPVRATSGPAAGEPNLTLTGEPRVVMGLLLGVLSPAKAAAEGVRADGNIGILDRLASERVTDQAETT
jgi:DNA-binding HxlR family transcriptional regulator